MKKWLPLFLWCLVIFAFSSIPQSRTAPQIWWDFLIKKTAHFLEFALLFAVSYRASKNFIFALIFSFLYAISDEFHQTLVPGREGTIRDVLIDSFGILIAFFVLWKYSQILPRKLLMWVKN